jgi:rhodanese-related sulfurtransferase
MHNFWIFVGQHWLLWALLVVLIIAIFIFEAFNKRGGAQALHAQEAISLMNNNEAIIVDIRSKEAFINGHIIGAINVPFKALQKDIEKLLDHKHKPIILVCAQGTEAARAAKMINKNEFENVSILKGGMRHWRDEKLPLEKGRKATKTAKKVKKAKKEAAND